MSINEIMHWYKAFHAQGLRVHILKTQQPFFGDVKRRIKKFEIRFNDRDYQIHDALILREWSPVDGYSGQFLLRSVSYITNFGMKDGYVCMGIDN